MFADRPGRFYVRPIILDGELDFVELDNVYDAAEVERIFEAQWGYVHGTVNTWGLEQLPAEFDGRRVVRDPAELDDLSRIGALEVEELYRELYG